MTLSRSNAHLVACCVILIGAAWLGSRAASATSITYHPLANTRALLTTPWTHVEVPGVVIAVHPEEDGDLHVVLASSARPACVPADFASGDCMVAEIRPLNRALTPLVRAGDRVLVDGVSRYDREHRWAEVHPVDHLLIVERAR